MAEICVALLTPFATSGDVALDALEMHTELLIAEGVTSLMPSGTTGEGMLLEPREVVEIVRCVARVARGRANVLAHVGRASTRETVAVAQRVVEMGVAAVSAVVPYYYRYSDAQIRDHYLALLGSVTAPVSRTPSLTVPGIPWPAASSASLPPPASRVSRISSKSLAVHREYLGVGIQVFNGRRCPRARVLAPWR